MLDKINKYIKISENGIAGQDARTKEWYCKEVPFKDEHDLKTKVSAINKVLNEANEETKKKSLKISKPKETIPLKM